MRYKGKIRWFHTLEQMNSDILSRLLRKLTIAMLQDATLHSLGPSREMQQYVFSLLTKKQDTWTTLSDKTLVTM